MNDWPPTLLPAHRRHGWSVHRIAVSLAFLAGLAGVAVAAEAIYRVSRAAAAELQVRGIPVIARMLHLPEPLEMIAASAADAPRLPLSGT